MRLTNKHNKLNPYVRDSLKNISINNNDLQEYYKSIRYNSITKGLPNSI